MARQPKLINSVITLLGEGKTSKEIKDETTCSDATLSIARKRLKEREGDLNEAAADINADVDQNVDGFIKSIKITPPPETPEALEDKEEDYVCPSCSHTWSASKTEKQEQCPNCGQEFN